MACTPSPARYESARPKYSGSTSKRTWPSSASKLCTPGFPRTAVAEARLGEQMIEMALASDAKVSILVQDVRLPEAAEASVAQEPPREPEIAGQAPDRLPESRRWMLLRKG